MVRPMVHSEKHYVQNSLFAIASGAVASLIQVAAVTVSTKNLATEIEEGSILKAIYLEYWVTSDDTSAGTAIWCLEKVPAGAAPLNAGDIAALNAYDNKKNILHTGMGLIPPNTQYPMNLVKGWFKIPKGKQRFGLSDELVFTILAQSNGISACGFTLYKEYK